jgi:WD40 repeat protein
MSRQLVLAGLWAALLLAGGTVAPAQPAGDEALPPQAVQRLGSLRLKYASVGDAQYLPDGRLLVLQGSTLEILDMSAGRRVAQHKLPFSAVSLDLTPDGHKVLLAGAEGSVGLFDLVEGKAGRSWPTDQVGLKYAQFSPDQTRLLSVGRMPPTIKEWEIETGRELQSIKGKLTYFDKAVYALGGKVAVAGGGYDTIEFWDLTTGELLATPAIHYSIYDLVASADGTRVLAGGRSYAYEFDVAERKILQRFGGHHGGAITGQCYGLAPDELFTGARDGSIRRWNRLEAKVLLRWLPHTNYARLLRASPDGQWIVSFASNQFLTESSVQTGQPRLPIARHAAAVEAVAWTTGGQVLSGSLDGTARLWDPVSGKCLATMPAGIGTVSVAGSPDGRRLAVGGKDGVIYEYDTAGKELRQLKGHRGYVRAVVYLPDGRLASSADDGSIRLWGEGTEPVATLTGHRGGVLALALADGQHLASAGRDGTVRLWVLTPEPRQLWSHTEHRGYVTCLSAGVQGRFYSGGRDGRIIGWQLKSGRLPGELEAGGWVRAVAQSVDGSRVWAGTESAELRAWSTTDGQPLPPLAGHQSGINGLVMSPDGSQLASASADATLLIWSP